MTTSSSTISVPILLVEDDPETRKLIARVLSEDGHAVRAVGRGAEATTSLMSHKFSVVILDVGLPDTSGVALCREWRRSGVRTPILILTAKTDVASRVAGLDAGADDYLGKPFAFAELRARLRALVRRGSVPLKERTFCWLDLKIDFGRRMAMRKDVEIPLTRRELDVFERLVAASGNAVSRDELLGDIWGHSTPEAGASLEVIVSRLRRKLDAPGSERLIRTVRGHGYAVAPLETSGE